MKPIYKPKGKAAEYCELAINIYTGCNHGCTYCFAEKMSKRFGKPFRENIKARPGIFEATEAQLKTGDYKGEIIQLCFMCDPYPNEPVDTIPTREIIKLIKQYGSNVQILTKGGKRAERDFDLLTSQDWFGITISGQHDNEPNAAITSERYDSLKIAKKLGIKTWISCEPVFNETIIYTLIHNAKEVDLFKIGKLNYKKSDIDWKEFGNKCEQLCKRYGRNYYIKDDLRKLME